MKDGSFVYQITQVDFAKITDGKKKVNMTDVWIIVKLKRKTK